MFPLNQAASQMPRCPCDPSLLVISTRRLTSLPSISQLTDQRFFPLDLPSNNRDASLVNHPAWLNVTWHQHTSTTGLGMPYRRALMTHISHRRSTSMRGRALAYSIGGDRCDVPGGKSVGTIDASKPRFLYFHNPISLSSLSESYLNWVLCKIQLEIGWYVIFRADTNY